jgi:hypothetical protein
MLCMPGQPLDYFTPPTLLRKRSALSWLVARPALGAGIALIQFGVDVALSYERLNLSWLGGWRDTLDGVVMRCVRGGLFGAGSTIVLRIFGRDTGRCFRGSAIGLVIVIASVMEVLTFSPWMRPSDGFSLNTFLASLALAVLVLVLTSKPCRPPAPASDRRAA